MRVANSLLLQFLSITLLSLQCLSLQCFAADDKESIFLDAIVASVDGKPITVSDVQRKLARTSPLSLSDISSDPEAKRAVEELIIERAIQEEASARGFKVQDAEVEEYMNEVAKQNGLSRDEFEKAVGEKGRNLPDYKDEVKIEILKSKLASSVVKRSVSVTDDEVKRFLSESGKSPSSLEEDSQPESSKVVLHHIFIDTRNRSDDEALDRLREVKQRLEDGDDFEDVAKEFSDAPDAASGGNLGAVSETDLDRDIYVAISKLEEGEISKPIPSEVGIRFVRLIEREDAPKRPKPSKEEIEAKSKFDENTINEAKKYLEGQKFQGKLASFFTEDLLKEHSVDRKI